MSALHNGKWKNHTLLSVLWCTLRFAILCGDVTTPAPGSMSSFHTPDKKSPEILELQGWDHGVGGRVNHKVHLCHPLGSAKSETFPKLVFCKQNTTEPGELNSHLSKYTLWQTRQLQGWKHHTGGAECSCLELAVFPRFPWTTLNTLVGKGWGAENEER